ncbi:ABC transporter substrate-binding protein [Canibacter sp. lx-45]|uniref:ABC transporter substrate-binding protein n=1 Tax=Canibacter zhuwentaonis TaxID=2837491 RepID=UPI001BDCF7ED|nr:ABC transporter substrate-binding protein [Canibacter zhuwentaonis]MBT1035335.1 ABC transporter substrate-binding protein [Canibacter zhuwentaonis]
MKNNKKWLQTALKVGAVVSAAALVLSGCSADQKAAEANQSKPELTPVTLMLNWTPNSHHAGIYYAKERGLYKDAGIDLKIIEPGADLGADHAVARGRVEFGISQAESLLPARAEGFDVTTIATILKDNDSGLLALKSSGIMADPKSLENKTYAGFGGALETEIISKLVECGGGDPSTVKFVDVGNVDALAAMEQKRFDTTWVFEGWSGVEAKLKGKDVATVNFSDHKNCIPNWYTPIIVTSDKLIKENSDLVKRFMEATSKGYDAVVKDPDAGSAALLKLAPELDEKLVYEAGRYYAPKFKQQGKFGEMAAEDWTPFTEFLVKAGMLKDNKALEGAWTNDFIVK